MQRLRDSDLAGNVLWLIVALVMATGVWYIAVTSADPIDSRRFVRIPVQFVPSDATVMTNDPTSTVMVIIQGSQSTVSSRRAEDIVVRADLVSLGAGFHSVPLDVRVAVPESGSRRRLVWHSEPSQITVELEPVESTLKEIIISVVEEPPLGFRFDEPAADITHVNVSGAATVVSEVVEVRGDLDLSSSRSPVEVDLRLYAVDADGARVDAVSLETGTAAVSVNITRRDDIRQIAVRPNILVGTQPYGYTLSTISTEPPSLFVSGAPDQLAEISDTLFTVPISLEDRRATFDITVPVQLPGDNLFVMGGDNNVTVSVELLPINTSRQIDSIEVGAIGYDEANAVSIVPQRVSAIVNGPVAQVDQLSANDIQVLVDLNGLAAGVYDLQPDIAINQGELNEDNVSLLPAVVNVEIIAPETTPAADDADNEEATTPSGG